MLIAEWSSVRVCPWHGRKPWAILLMQCQLRPKAVDNIEEKGRWRLAY
jgi:hypothetical protein